MSQLTSRTGLGRAIHADDPNSPGSPGSSVPNDNVDILTEAVEESDQPVGRETGRLSSEQERDLGLGQAEQVPGGRLGQAAPAQQTDNPEDDPCLGEALRIGPHRAWRRAERLGGAAGVLGEASDRRMDRGAGDWGHRVLYL